jgi:cysteine desulfurase
MAIKLPVYFDNHATTPVDPRVLDAMLPYFTETFGNAASRNHEFGWKAEEAVENARGQIARLINATPKEIIFTSGATESTNLAIKGAAEMYREKGNHIITQVTEHKATLDTCKRLEKYGYEVTYLPVEKDGRINLEELRRAITPKTILISIMYANNEIGVVQPIAEIGKIAKEKGIFFHVDGVQPARAAFRDYRRRRPRARHAFGHAQRDRNRRPGQSMRALPAGDGRRIRETEQVARPPEGLDHDAA